MVLRWLWLKSNSLNQKVEFVNPLIDVKLLLKYQDIFELLVFYIYIYHFMFCQILWYTDVSNMVGAEESFASNSSLKFFILDLIFNQFSVGYNVMKFMRFLYSCIFGRGC